jgi:hypothetical protein
MRTRQVVVRDRLRRSIRYDKPAICLKWWMSLPALGAGCPLGLSHSLLLGRAPLAYRAYIDGAISCAVVQFADRDLRRGGASRSSCAVTRSCSRSPIVPAPARRRSSWMRRLSAATLTLARSRAVSSRAARRCSNREDRRARIGSACAPSCDSQAINSVSGLVAGDGVDGLFLKAATHAGRT